MRYHGRFARFGVAILIGAGGACDGGDPAAPEEGSSTPPPSVPGPGPYYTVSPVDLDKIARITPTGTNGKVFPIGHSYWYTCDTEYLMPTTRPCVRERLPIRAPGPGVVIAVDHVADGGIAIEGPPGLRASFAHVTPRPGIARGDSVRAGDVIATMYTDFAFDFGLINLGATPHSWVRADRYANQEGYRYAQHPVSQFSEPLRTQLLARINSLADPLGRISYDVAGTAAGNWFLLGVPLTDPLRPLYESSHLFIGRLQERNEVRILTKGGGGWYPDGYGVAVADAAAPSWDAITPASGPVQIRLWNLDRDGGPMLDTPYGSVLIEVMAGERIRIEWFNTHAPVTAFTSAALTYER